MIVEDSSVCESVIAYYLLETSTIIEKTVVYTENL